MEERLLLDWVALHARDIAPRHPQAAPIVVADLADADCPIRNGTPVSARNAPEPVRIEAFVKVPLPGVPTEGFGEGGHRQVLWWREAPPSLDEGDEAFPYLLTADSWSILI